MLPLVSGLDAAHAEMLAADLQDLQIPAVVREHRPDIPPDPHHHHHHHSGLRAPSHALEVLVPETLHEVALQVIDVTAMAPEGDTPVHEILEEIEQGAEPGNAADSTLSLAETTPGFSIHWYMLLAALAVLAVFMALFLQ